MKRSRVLWTRPGPPLGNIILPGGQWVCGHHLHPDAFLMDGRGRWIDNRMVERLWRSVKYECVYLHAFETGSQARREIGKWMDYYNEERPHSSHGILTPNEAYGTIQIPKKLAA